jgi:hypothetical protein
MSRRLSSPKRRFKSSVGNDAATAEKKPAKKDAAD